MDCKVKKIKYICKWYVPNDFAISRVLWKYTELLLYNTFEWYYLASGLERETESATENVQIERVAITKSHLHAHNIVRYV